MNNPTFAQRRRETLQTQDTDSDVPLVVDVDGTLLMSDLLHESMLRLAVENPLAALSVPLWLARGKAVLKSEITSQVRDGALPPLRLEVLELIKRARSAGRRVYLASASHTTLVEGVAKAVGGVDGVFATTSRINLAGDAKAEALIQAFGPQGYDYIGDADVDFPVWRSARRVLAVSHSEGFERRLRESFPNAEIIASSRESLRTYVRALRPHQWGKNVLVFLTIIVGQNFSAEALLYAISAFVCFCLAASSAYTFNDLLDLPADRQHPTKRLRPYAAGQISVKHGVLLGFSLLLGAITLSAAVLSIDFIVVLLLYYLGTVAYSLVLKRKVLIDVVTLGALYTLRVLAGEVAVEAHHSNWLLMFCLFLFLHLAIAKRYSELRARQVGGGGPPSGRGYRFEDMQVLLPLGAAAGYVSVLVISLYLTSDIVVHRYSRPDILWLVCPLLVYWVSRVMVLTNRGHLHEDPVVFALTDKVSWATTALVGGLIVAAT